MQTQLVKICQLPRWSVSHGGKGWQFKHPGEPVAIPSAPERGRQEPTCHHRLPGLGNRRARPGIVPHCSHFSGVAFCRTGRVVISLSAPSRAAVNRRKNPHQSTDFEDIDAARYPQGQSARTFFQQELPGITRPPARYLNAPPGNPPKLPCVSNSAFSPCLNYLSCNRSTVYPALGLP